jgi:hypothetical protein
MRRRADACICVLVAIARRWLMKVSEVLCTSSPSDASIPSVRHITFSLYSIYATSSPPYCTLSPLILHVLAALSVRIFIVRCTKHLFSPDCASATAGRCAEDYFPLFAFTVHRLLSRASVARLCGPPLPGPSLRLFCLLLFCCLIGLV